MNGHRITLLGTTDTNLQKWLTGHPQGHERGAIVLFRKLDRAFVLDGGSERFVAVDFIQMDGDWIIDSSSVHLRINLRKLPEIFYRCETEGLELGFVHNHPSSFLGFSEKDDANEQNILQGYSGSNGPNVAFIALVLSDSQWCARVRYGANPEKVHFVRHVAVVSDNIRLHIDPELSTENKVLARQEAAFGKPFNQKLQSLRVSVVGAGGTGSSVATLLARAGVGELIIIDGDMLEETNLNRVRGYRKKDVGKNKAEVLTDYINGLGLSTIAKPVPEFLGTSPIAVDALSSSDVVFGCTDDVAGRDIMNEALYYYGFAYIDTGLTGKVDMDLNNQPYLRDHRGRVSCILPESGRCLRCQRVVTEDKLQYEQAVKERPELADIDAETLLKEYYLVGGGEQAPGVGPFTSATADNAVATLFHLIKPFRKMPSDLRLDNVWYDFVHTVIHSNEPFGNEDCMYCISRKLLLKDEGGFRLERPALGKYV